MFPNPFLSHTKIDGTLEQVKIYDVSGRLIAKTENDIWNGEDLKGNEVQPGIYLLRLNGKPVGKVVKVR